MRSFEALSILSLRLMRRLVEITEATGCTNVELKLIDLASFASVKSFADIIDQEYDRLDLLIENAATAYGERVITEDGWEQTYVPLSNFILISRLITVFVFVFVLNRMQVNVLSQELLSILLLPKMFKTAQKYNTLPRIVVVSSEVHYWAEFDFNSVVEEPHHDIHRVIGDKVQLYVFFENCFVLRFLI